MFETVGRQQELDSLTRFIDTPRRAPAALVLEGEPGIGKSTLWLAGVEHARSHGLRVLWSRPAEAERGLAHAALGDLLETVLDEVLPALSVPRQQALKVAMLRDEVSDGPVDHRAVAVAVRDVLQLLSADRPTVVAIDDLQWLDQSSSAALAFALRRLSESPVLMLLARRLGDTAQYSSLERALLPEAVHRVAVPALSVGAIHQLLRNRLGRAFPRQTLLRVHEQSGGNPFFALELARVLGPDVDPAQPLPVPRTLEDILRTRMQELPEATRLALALASALGTISESLLHDAGVSAHTLEPAFAAQMILREGGMVRFTHPLLASIVYRDLGEGRRAVHARIAEVVEDPLLRARHLALATAAPDAALAAELAAAALLALDRSAPAVAAELYEQAARLTAPEASDERSRLALAAARAHQLAGEWTRAGTIAQRLLAETRVGTWRAEALIVLAELEGTGRATDLLEEALREAAASPALQSAINCRLAWVTRFKTDRDYAGAALEVAEQLHDDMLRTRARAVQAILGWFRGEAPAPDDLSDLAQHLPEAVGGERLVQEATQAIVNTLAPASRREEARALLEHEHRMWRERNEPRSARALWGLAWVELWAGRWELAAEHAAQAHDVATQYGLEVPQDHLPAAVIAVHRGDLELARGHSERALELATAQFGFHPPQHLAVLALVALGNGDESAALGLFAKAEERATDLGWGEPSMRWWTGDLIELQLGLGRTADAAHLLQGWEDDATRVDREWVLAQAMRCRGLVEAALGNVEGALARLADAVVMHEAVGDPFGRARALLALGMARRRTRQKRPAREDMEAALEGFEALGARAWAARARAELGRVGGRVHLPGLTDAERRVVALVAEGRTNREIAAALFLGERTVASHLSHIYSKLGVRSRMELARRLH